MSTERPHYRDVKTAIRKSLFAGTFLVGRYGFSPYMACGHGCAYCDGRAERYWVEGEFDQDIVVRRNLPEVLAREIGRLRERATVTVGSGISDAYQPIEGREGLMRRCAEVFAEHDFPVTILTKSALVLRDLDLWSRVIARGGFNLFVSLTTATDDLRAIFEPGADTVEQRLEALRAVKSAGGGTGVLALPLLPYISDTPERVEKLLYLCGEVGVDFVMAGEVTLRPGRQKDFFMRRLADHFPDLVEDYERLFGQNRASGVCLRSYRGELHPRLQRQIEEARDPAGRPLPSEEPHHLYKGKIPPYDELSVLLGHMIGLYQRRGVDTQRLKRGLEGYRRWLEPLKRTFNRRRSLDQGWLEAHLAEAIDSGELSRIVDNEKLASFMARAVEPGCVFDYTDLQLRSPER